MWRDLRSRAGSWWDQQVLETREAAAVLCSRTIPPYSGFPSLCPWNETTFFLTPKKWWQSLWAYTPRGMAPPSWLLPTTALLSLRFWTPHLPKMNAPDSLHHSEEEVRFSNPPSTMTAAMTCSQSVREAEGQQKDGTLCHRCYWTGCAEIQTRRQHPCSASPAQGAHLGRPQLSPSMGILVAPTLCIQT